MSSTIFPVAEKASGPIRTTALSYAESQGIAGGGSEKEGEGI